MRIRIGWLSTPHKSPDKWSLITWIVILLALLLFFYYAAALKYFD
jgi:hypothetical protein